MCLARLQLSNEAALRMQRYLRQPLSVLAGIIGKRGQDVVRLAGLRLAVPFLSYRQKDG